jgi:YHS domain-containing protein
MSRQHAVAPAEVLDPVCGMTITPEDAVGHLDHRGQTYYFCSQSCVDQFRANPDRFLKAADKPPAASSANSALTR